MKKIRVKKSNVCPDGIATIYTIAEAKKFGIKYLPYNEWPHAEEGDRVETNDGYVTIIIKRSDTNPENAYVKTPTGCFNIHRPNSSFDTEMFFNRNSFSRKPRWSREGKLTPQQEKFWEIFEKTLNIDLALRIAYPKLDQFSRDVQAKYIYNSPRFKRFVMGLKTEAEKQGLTIEKVLRRLSQAVDETDTNSRNFTEILKMAAVACGVDDFSPNLKQLDPGRRPLFDNTSAEEADYEDVEDNKKLKMVSGPVRKEAS